MRPDEEVDQQTGEVVETGLAVREDSELAMQKGEFYGMSEQPFDEATANILLAAPNPEVIEIRPDGLIYYPQVEIRRILNKAFGPGGWALRPIRTWVDQSRDGFDVVMYEGELWAHGRYVARSVGEHKYRSSNDNTSYATAHESAKSDCITRCIKDLGVVADLWNPRFAKAWVDEYAVKVWCSTKDGKRKPFWRRKDDPPIDMFPWKEETGQPTGNEESDVPPGRRDTTVSVSEPKRAGLKDYLNRAGELKDQLRSVTGSNDVYYAILKAFGHRHANDVKDLKQFREIGLRLAWAVDALKRVEVWKMEVSSTDAVIAATDKVGMKHAYDFPWGGTLDALKDTLAALGEAFDNA